MALSTRCRQLVSRSRVLRSRSLPAKFSPTGVYKPIVLDRARAYRVLLHAELESYFEDRALDISDKAHALWRSKGRASKPIAGMVANLDTNIPRLPKVLGSNRSIASLVGQAVALYQKQVSANHGVKDENLIKIFLPLGIDEADFDQAWLATITAFGTKRGIAAHGSWITYQIDPLSELNDANLIIQGLQTFDGVLTKNLARIR